MNQDELVIQVDGEKIRGARRGTIDTQRGILSASWWKPCSQSCPSRGVKSVLWQS